MLQFFPRKKEREKEINDENVPGGRAGWRTKENCVLSDWEAGKAWPVTSAVTLLPSWAQLCLERTSPGPALDQGAGGRLLPSPETMSLILSRQ